MKILHITSELDGGGIERLLFDYYKRINGKGVFFDFAISAHTEGILETPLKRMKCNIFRIPRMRGGFLKYAVSLRYILIKGNYDIIHVHSAYKAFLPILIAKTCGIKVRIAHSHIANAPETMLWFLLRRVLTPITKLLSTDLFACGIDAGQWVWGNNTSFFIMQNAIDVKRFAFSMQKRTMIRDNLRINNKFVIGNVARFSYQKNHEFLLKAFAEVVKTKKDVVLLLIGQGELENEVIKQISKLGIKDKVMMLGVRNDVPDLLNAMDLFLLPSHFEGLPVTLVEAQANGLTALVSNNITKEMDLGEFIHFLPLQNSVWVKEISDNIEQPLSINHRLLASLNIANSLYNIDRSANRLLQKYNELIETRG